MATPLTLRKADVIGAGLALAAFLAILLAVFVPHKIRFAASESNAPVVTVTQRNREYHPDTLTITRGTVLHIVNDDRFTHHVYVKSPTMNFDSEDPVGTSVDVEFDHLGTFDVQCAIHPTMNLWVTVK